MVTIRATIALPKDRSRSEPFEITSENIVPYTAILQHDIISKLV